MPDTKFSVSMCVYIKDTPEWFTTAVESVLNQTVKPSEVVLVVDGPVEIAQECEANHLALCPLCAAKYKELAQRSLPAMDDLKQALHDADIEGSLEIPLSLGEKEGMVTLRFTQRHLVDIQAMLDS